ncbi:MAG: UDP-N-acetylmuramate:L-alanyl-gamma-D-glutamyl-meso-diaminopimelate ligase [Myxococcota bacterium]
MTSLDIHLIGICGTGMGSFAGLLQAAGHRVRGSDQNVYPPMSDKLRAWGIPVAEGYRPENLEPRPDLVVVGNVVRRDNPEARAAIDGGLEYTSFPEALGRLFLAERRSLVVAGTHGKTTTTSLLAWVLAQGGHDPGLLVGGVPENFGEGFRLGRGETFVVEGDEYDTAFFDKRPKFLLYRPWLAVMTSLEYDHADIYPDVETIEARFDDLSSLVPSSGRILACASAPRVLARRPRAKADWQTYAVGTEAQWVGEKLETDGTGTRFSLLREGTSLGELFLPMAGRHNVENAVAVAAIGLQEGLSLDEIREGFRTFKGIARRQTVRAEVDGIRIIDDFAHHPTAVSLTLDGLRARYGSEGRIFAIFEPRTATSSRRYFQDAYAEAFEAADEVLIAPVGRAELPSEERLDVVALAAAISARGRPARAFDSLDAIVETLVASARPGDSLVFMSNGGFGGIHATTEAALRG